MYFNNGTAIFFNKKFVKVARENNVIPLTATAAMISEIRLQ